MKPVNQNEKKSKKLNLVDAIVLLLVLVVLAAFGWKLVSARATAAEEELSATEQAYEKTDHLVFQVVCLDVPRPVAEAMQAQPEKDRQIMNNAKPVEAYITDISYEVVEDNLCTLYFTVEASLIEKDDIYSVGTQEIRIGKGYIIKTYQIETSGYIFSMEVKKNG